MICCGWRPGDTLLHWAVRRGDATSDDVLLALLEAGYDADALNLSCPCFCMSATTPREIAEGSGHPTHATLLQHGAKPRQWAIPKVEWHEGVGEDGMMVPGQVLDGLWTPVDAMEPEMHSEIVKHGMHAPGASTGSQHYWSELVAAVKDGNTEQIAKITASDDFDVDWRPSAGCCGASYGCCNDGNQVLWTVHCE